MKKLGLIALSEDKAAMLSELMALGFVEINSPDGKLGEEGWAELVGKDNVEARVRELEEEISRADAILELLDKFDDSKPPLIKERTPVSLSDFEQALQGENRIIERIANLTEIAGCLAAQSEEINRAENTKLALAPWEGYDVPAEEFRTRFTETFQGTVSADTEYENFEEALKAGTELAYSQLVSKDADFNYVSVTLYSPEKSEIMDLLRDIGFVRIGLPMSAGTVEENIARTEEKLIELRQGKEEIEKSVSEHMEFKPTLELYKDALSIRRDKEQIRERLLVTDSTFFLEGWLPRIGEEKIKEFLDGYSCWYDISEPAEDDDVPVLLLNSKFTEPFEAVTELYSLPDYRGVDATPFFSFLYAVLFGMMFSDAAYGIILSAVTYYVKKKYELEGMMKKFVEMFFYCGISTVFWGLMFGSFFGDIVTHVSTTFFGSTVSFPTLWLNPLEEPLKLLVFSYLLGMIHIFIGMGLSGYMSIRDGQFWDAVFDVFFWYVFIVGVIGWLANNMATGVPPMVTAVCKWMTIISAAGIFLTAGRHNKGIVSKITGGLSALYGSSGYFSDILSYSRLLALGLATGVMSSVFNTLGSLGGGGIAGLIIMLVAFVIGHSYNFVINVLGSFVHASRLQYVEFFGKFYVDGGEAFRPFRKETQYIKIVKEEQ